MPTATSVPSPRKPRLNAASAAGSPVNLVAPPLSTCQTKTSPPQPALTACRPSGRKAQTLTQPLWPVRRCTGAPVSTSHTNKLWSSEPERSWRPSGENDRHFTPARCPAGAASFAPLGKAGSAVCVAAAWPMVAIFWVPPQANTSIAVPKSASPLCDLSMDDMASQLRRSVNGFVHGPRQRRATQELAK